jgi:hypothetical protein
VIVLAIFVLTPLIVAAVAGVFVRRAWVVATVGAALVLAFLVFAYLQAPSTSETPCHDCSDFHGRWIEVALVEFLGGMWLFSWLVGLGVGRGVRVFRSRAVE